MKNALIAALVALLVATTFGTAAQHPLPIAKPSPPSTSDVNTAQSKSINQLKSQVANLYHNQNEIINAVQPAIDMTNCITDILPVDLQADERGEYLTPTDTGNPNAVLLAVIDPQCAT